jgi:hypothetical protein
MAREHSQGQIADYLRLFASAREGCRVPISRFGAALRAADGQLVGRRRPLLLPLAVHVVLELAVPAVLVALVLSPKVITHRTENARRAAVLAWQRLRPVGYGCRSDPALLYARQPSGVALLPRVPHAGAAQYHQPSPADLAR